MKAMTAKKFELVSRNGEVWLTVYTSDGDYTRVRLDDDDLKKLHRDLLALPPRPIPAASERLV